MVARRGNAPRSAGCEPVALLLSYQAMKKWRPHPVMLRGFLVENQACCYCTMRAEKVAERQGVEPWTPFEGATVFKTASSTGRTRSVAKWLPDVDSHHDEPLNRRPCYFDIIREWRSRQELHLRRSV